MLTFDEYQNIVENSAIYPKEFGIAYPVLGLNGEAGEVAEKVKKLIRDKDYKHPDAETIEGIIKELGDCLWYLTMAAKEYNFRLKEVAEINAEKILSRKERNVQHGSGDNR